MIEMHIPINVPENRRITVDLPADVPLGPNNLHICIEATNAPTCSSDVADHVVKEFEPRPTNPEMAQDFDVFQRMLPDLLLRYRGQYAAIHHGRLIGMGRDRTSVLTKAYQLCGSANLYVGLVSDKPVRRPQLPSPQLAKN